MRIRRWAATALIVVAASGCGPVPENPIALSPEPSLSVTPPSTSPTPTDSPSPSPTLPLAFPLPDGLLDGGAGQVVRKMDEISGGRQGLKLDVTKEQVTLTVLTPDKSAATYRWRDGVIETVDSDVRYVGQATFHTVDYRLDNLRRLFDVAALLGAKSDQQILQVQEYRSEVLLTVTTRPETKTIFFRPDGTAIRQLGTSSVGDISDGITDVTAKTSKVIAVGFNTEAGYWADVRIGDGVVERRSRLGNLPAFSSRRNDRTQLKAFDPSTINPSAITVAIATFRSEVTQTCSVEVDNRFDRSAPVVRYDCGGRIFYTDLAGADMTKLVG